MQKTIQFRGARVSFEDTGKGRVVVFLHGFLGSSTIWSSLASQLCRSYRIISIDLPGHGESECLGYVHSMDLMAEAVKAVLDQLRLKKYVLAGHSMGGYVALAFADRFPDNVKGLALLHSTGYSDSLQKKTDRLRAAEVVKSDKKLYTRSTIKSLFARRNLRYLKNEIRFASKIASQTSRQGIVAALLGMRDRPARDLILAMVSYPVLMVAGANDTVLPPEQLTEQANTLRNGTFVLLEYDGHFGFLESPGYMEKVIRKFLRKCF